MLLSAENVAYASCIVRQKKRRLKIGIEEHVKVLYLQQRTQILHLRRHRREDLGRKERS